MAKIEKLPIDHENKLLVGNDSKEVLRSFSNLREIRKKHRYEVHQLGIQRTLNQIFTKCGVSLPKYKNPFILDLACGSCPDAEGITDFFMGNTYSRDNKRDGLYVGVETNTPALFRADYILSPKNRDVFRQKNHLVVIPRDNAHLEDSSQFSNKNIRDIVLLDSYTGYEMVDNWLDHLPELDSNHSKTWGIHFFSGDARDIEKLPNYSEISKGKKPNVVFIGQPDLDYGGKFWGSESNIETWKDIMIQGAEILDQEGYLIITLYHENELKAFETNFPDSFWEEHGIVRLGLWIDQDKSKWWSENGLKPMDKITGNYQKQSHHGAILFQKK